MTEDRENVKRVRAWLQELVHVELTDGRVVEGRLECFDKLGNMILSDAIEVASANGNHSRCRLGLVLAPGNAQVCVRVRKARDAEVVAEGLQRLDIGDEETRERVLDSLSVI